MVLEEFKGNQDLKEECNGCNSWDTKGLLR